MNSLSLAYITSRRDCKIEWFWDSLQRELNGRSISVIVVDFHRNERDVTQGIWQTIRQNTLHVAPKPCVWQGDFKLVKTNHWAAANMRNTALCLAPDGYLSYIDDLSVIMPGWLKAVDDSIAGNYVVCGTYRKVKKMVVEKGVLVSYEPFSEDNRMKGITQDVSPCSGGWMYGCTLGAPIDLFLKVGGWPEFSDALKFEDCLMGIGMQNAGCHLKFDRRMLSIESEEHHHIEPAFRSFDKGVSPNDKSHAAKKIAEKTKYFANYYEGGIPQLRKDVLAGKPFPTTQIPEHDWYDGQPLSEIG